MALSIRTQLDYQFNAPTVVLLQVEAAALSEQAVEDGHIAISPHSHFARVSAQDDIGERIWLRAEGRFTVDYRARVAIRRIVRPLAELEMVPHHLLPGATVQYLMPSRYCPSDKFESFVAAEFGTAAGGANVAAMRAWVHEHFSYVPGSSASDTTAVDSFIRREGVCRDYAHVLITLARAAGIPARIASVYAVGVKPQDFHAVAEVFVGNEWHLVDATGMAHESAMAKIGIGRDAADVAFLTTYGTAVMNSQSVTVEAVD